MKLNKGGFSWKRFLGITQVKRNISRKTGIPLTKSGREQKIGRMVTKGCMGNLVLLIGILSVLLVLFV